MFKPRSFTLLDCVIIASYINGTCGDHYVRSRRVLELRHHFQWSSKDFWVQPIMSLLASSVGSESVEQLLLQRLTSALCF